MASGRAASIAVAEPAVPASDGALVFAKSCPLLSFAFELSTSTAQSVCDGSSNNCWRQSILTDCLDNAVSRLFERASN